MITLLHEDMKYILKHWCSNPMVSVHQLEHWPRTGRKIAQSYLSNNAPQCLRLLEEDGEDGEPVFNLPKDSSRILFYVGTDYYPVIKSSYLIRLAKFGHLGCERGLFLVLKSLWQEYLWNDPTKILKKMKYKPRIEWIDVLSQVELADQSENEAFKNYILSNDLYNEFEQQNNYASKSGYCDKEKFDELIAKAIAINAHQAAVYSREVNHLVRVQWDMIERMAINYALYPNPLTRQLNRVLNYNPHLAYQDGDISYWHQNCLKNNWLEYHIICQFSARQRVLNNAESTGEIIKEQGDLSCKAGEAIGHCLRGMNNTTCPFIR